MTSSDSKPHGVVSHLRDLSRYYVLSDNSTSDGCLTKYELLERARSRQGDLLDSAHFSECSRCASLLTAFKNHVASEELPLSFAISLRCNSEDFISSDDDSAQQLLGRISFTSQEFRSCELESDWTSTSGEVRVNLVVDMSLHFFSLSILDVPDRIFRVALHTPQRELTLSPSVPGGTFELVLGDFKDSVDAVSIEELFGDLIQSHIGLSFAARPRSKPSLQADVLSLLHSMGAVEQEFDYILPSGRHSDTHVNISRVCHSEAALSRLTECFDQLVPEEFDVIVTNGWPMSVTARRLAALRNTRNPTSNVREILYEGYEAPQPVEELTRGSRVLVLTDVSITGNLVSKLVQNVQVSGSHVVAKATVVLAKNRSIAPQTDLRSLCRIPMALSLTGRARALEWREQRYFNPLTNCMTQRKEYGRSPSQFYDQDADAQLLWDFLEDLFDRTKDVVRFFRRHKIIGDTHYTEYIDTFELLQEPVARAFVTKKLFDKLSSQDIRPDALLVPDRKRAKLLAKLLQDSLHSPGKAPIPILDVHRIDGRWSLSPKDWPLVAGKEVLIVDTAVGHGRTIDQLAMLAMGLGAERVAATVILSRLSEGCEEALNARLTGGFYRLFNLPIRPVVIRGHSHSLCPVCQQRSALEHIVDETESDAIEQFYQHRFRPKFLPNNASITASNDNEANEVQQTLFPETAPRFLSRCRASVARGLTLHSLYAAKNNGMAPLALPELLDEDVSSRNKEAMVKDLPCGALSWSSGFLDQDLERLLASGIQGSVWSASAFVYAVEGKTQWRDYLSEMINRSPQLRNRPQPQFWNRLACSVYLNVKENESLRTEIQQELLALAHQYRGTDAERGISQAVEVISSIASSTEIQNDGRCDIGMAGRPEALH